MSKRKISIALALFLICMPTLSEESVEYTPENVYWVILAGGGGTRLWPLSTEAMPKQFLSVTDKSLLEQSVDRLTKYPNFDKTNVVVSTGVSMVGTVEKIQKKMQMEGSVGKVDEIVAEPGRKDTGPAILFTVLKILAKNPNAIIMFLPADPFIPSEQNAAFAKYLESAVKTIIARPDNLVLLGKKPNRPATGFGYIQAGEQVIDHLPSLRILQFKEKPSRDVAEGYVARGDMLWNMGIFGGTGKTFSDLFALYSRNIFDGVSAAVKADSAEEATEIYMGPEVEKKSVDFAVMEGAGADSKLTVIPVNEDVVWDDVGDFDVFLDIRNQFFGRVEPRGNKSFSEEEKQIVFGDSLEGYCVVDTKAALLVVKCSDAGDIKTLVANIEKKPGWKHYVTGEEGERYEGVTRIYQGEGRNNQVREVISPAKLYAFHESVDNICVSDNVETIKVFQCDRIE